MAATDTYLLERLRRILKDRNQVWIEKRMFGGDCFMVDDKMCFGTFQGGLLVRIDQDEMEELLKRESTSIMKMGDREMKGFLRVEPEGYDTESDLEFWVDRCLAYNPKAKSSKKK